MISTKWLHLYIIYHASISLRLVSSRPVIVMELFEMSGGVISMVIGPACASALLFIKSYPKRQRHFSKPKKI